jgi:DNA gyrase subunit A
VTELPYLVGPEKVIEKIKQGVQSKKLAGISQVTDLTDRKSGLKLVIELKTGFAPEAVLEQLYRHTPLEDSFHINNVAIVDTAPKTLGLREMLDVYLKHRISAVRRRSQFRLNKHKDRLHLVDGLLIALVDIDEVIEIIRSSDDAEAARSRLMLVFDLSERQAEYILELRLRRLTKFSRIELETEADELRRKIAELEALLADEQLLRQAVSQELSDTADQFATPRRTVLIADDTEIRAAKQSAKSGTVSPRASRSCARSAAQSTTRSSPRSRPRR